MDRTEAAYAAGIIDGEGSIELQASHAHRARGRYVYPRVRLANTDKRMIDWMEKRFPGSRHSTHYQIQQERKAVHHLTWVCKQAVYLLREIEEFLVVKKEQAEIALAVWSMGEKLRAEAGGYFGNGHPIPNELLEFRFQSMEQISKLNRRGVCR